MRKLLVLFAASVFASACGGSSSSSGGGGGGGLTGTVGGRPFTAADVKALVAGSGTTPCPLPITGLGTVPVGIKAFALEITSYADACADFTSAVCKFHPNAQTVTVLFAKLAPPSIANPTPAEPTLSPGTFTIYASPTTAVPDGTSGNLLVTFAQAIATDATCNGGTPTPAPAASGTLRLDQVTGPITGHISVTFTGGGSLNGDFSAPLCTGLTPLVCALATAGEICAMPGTCGP